MMFFQIPHNRVILATVKSPLDQLEAVPPTEPVTRYPPPPVSPLPAAALRSPLDALYTR